jgi:hypothetical protein
MAEKKYRLAVDGVLLPALPEHIARRNMKGYINAGREVKLFKHKTGKLHYGNFKVIDERWL